MVHEEKDVAARESRGGGWREAFLNRHRRGGGEGEEGDYDASVGGAYGDTRDARPRNRSLSRPRAGDRSANSRSLSRSRAADAGVSDAYAEAFNQKAVLDQDRALIEQLTQRQTERQRPAVRKPPPPPKVTPYRPRSGPTGATENHAVDAALEVMPEPGVAGLAATAPDVLRPAGGDTAPFLPAPAQIVPPVDPYDSATSTASARQEGAMPAPSMCSPSAAAPIDAAPLQLPQLATVPTTPTLASPTSSGQMIAAGALALPTQAVAPLQPVVPQVGGLFTTSDIDNIMDRLGGVDSRRAPPGVGAEAIGGETALVGSAVGDSEQCTQNFGDITSDFFRNHGMDPPAPPPPPPKKEELRKTAAGEFEVPQRKALREQIQAIDSWLEDDFSAREKLSKANGPKSRGDAAPMPPTLLTNGPVAAVKEDASGGGGPPGVNVSAEADVLRSLEDVKRRKALGEKPSLMGLKNVAAQAKPLFPTMTLEALVQCLRLFTSARYEDHDLYLRILGEIPMQIRGITPELLTTCIRVLWRLRLHEETYLELFSMEAMNMIRARRRTGPRAPRRAPAPGRNAVPRQGDAETSAVGSSAPAPTPPSAPPPSSEAPSPFSAAQLIHIGNALSQLGAKYPPRFMEVYQEQFALAIPRLTHEECELVCPTLAMSQLIHDPLRRSFLERCAQVGAGSASVAAPASGAIPDIAQYHRDAEDQRRRVKNMRNVYVVEASVRKETFSFFASLPVEVRTYLDKLHADASKLRHEGSGALALQVAGVLEQLGVVCYMDRMAGPLDLHIVAKATNPTSEVAEIVYECSEVSAYHAAHQDDKGATPQLTAYTKLRQRLLQRLGIQLVHIGSKEWQQMSEAQRINYMVKLQSL